MQPTSNTSPREAEPTSPVSAPAIGPGPETRGCLYALSQPPLMLFLTVIGVLLALCGAHDLLLL